MSDTEPGGVAAPEGERAAAIAALARRLADDRFSRGDLAELRRFDPTRETTPTAAAFWRLLLDHVPPGLRTNDTDERLWAVVFHGLAVMAPTHHRQGARPGRVLWEAGYTDLRLNRLLAADADQRPEAIGRLARFLRAKGLAIDWVQLARLIFARADEQVERQCRAIARDFYGAEHERRTQASTTVSHSAPTTGATS